MKINKNDIIGLRNGKLTIVEYVGSWKDTYATRGNRLESKIRHVYVAKCDCGKTKLVRRDAFLEGLNKSCGCKCNRDISCMDEVITGRISSESKF